MAGRPTSELQLTGMRAVGLAAVVGWTSNGIVASSDVPLPATLSIYSRPPKCLYPAAMAARQTPLHRAEHSLKSSHSVK